MPHRSLWAGFAGLCALLPLAAQAPADAADPKEILRRAMRMDAHNRELERTYTYVERHETRTLDARGAVTHRESTTWDVVPLRRSMYRRLTQRDDKPLSPKEERQQEAARQKTEAARQKADALRDAETPAGRQKRLAARERARQQEQRDKDEIVEGFDLRLAGEEQIDGIPVWVIDGAPRAGYKFKPSQLTGIVSRMKGRIWIAKSDYQPVRIEAETTGTLSFGGVLARIYKGTRVHVEYTRVNGEVWLTKRFGFTVSGRILLLKGLHEEEDSVYSGFRKFSADSRLVTGEP